SRYSSTTRTRRAAAMSASLRSIRSSFAGSRDTFLSVSRERRAGPFGPAQPQQERLVFADALLQVEDRVDLLRGSKVTVPVRDDLDDPGRERGGIARSHERTHARDPDDLPRPGDVGRDERRSGKDRFDLGAGEAVRPAGEGEDVAERIEVREARRVRDQAEHRDVLPDRREIGLASPEEFLVENVR